MVVLNSFYIKKERVYNFTYLFVGGSSVLGFVLGDGCLGLSSSSDEL